MKKLFIIILLLTGFTQAQFLTLLNDSDSPDAGYAFFKTSDGEYFKTSTSQKVQVIRASVEEYRTIFDEIELEQLTANIYIKEEENEEDTFSNTII